MWGRKSPYTSDGRLSDVIAAVTVLAAHKDSTNKIEDWATHLSKVTSVDDRARETARWRQVFLDHPEFFIVYQLPSEQFKKAALRLRYANKTIDSKTGNVPENYATMSLAEKSRLGSLPLEPGAVNDLTTIAINIHAATMAQLSDSRYWIPPALGLLGILAGGVITAAISLIHSPTSPAKVELHLNGAVPVRVEPKMAPQ